jgi:hypothetical protein
MQISNTNAVKKGEGAETDIDQENEATCKGRGMSLQVIILNNIRLICV